MKVTYYIINEGQPSQYYGLWSVEDAQVLPYAPRWKTIRGAKRWAEKNGLEFVG